MSSDALAISIPDEFVEAVAQRVAEILAEQRVETHSPWLTIDEAAEYSRIPKQSLYKFTAAKAIPHVKQGNRVLFRRDALDEWLDGYREGPDVPTGWRS